MPDWTEIDERCELDGQRWKNLRWHLSEAMRLFELIAKDGEAYREAARERFVRGEREKAERLFASVRPAAKPSLWRRIQQWWSPNHARPQ